MKEIVFAGGCFWGVQAYFDMVEGVEETYTGYANGDIENPSYEQVCTGLTGYAEAVYIKYNERKVTLKNILEKYWEIIDPTLKNQQGADIGHQYRTGIYYIYEKDLKTINSSRQLISQKYSKPIVTEIKKLENFFKAEEYHQKYLMKNPDGYCHINLY